MTSSNQQPDQEQSLQVISVPQIANQQQWTGTLSNEDPLEREYRLKRQADDEMHKRWRATSLFAATLLVIAIVFVGCIQILRHPASVAEDKKWATATIASIVSAGIGFVTGKAIA